MEFDREAYLERIGLDQEVAPTEAGLETIHRAQTYTIPFENLDIHLGRDISLKPARLIEKLVRHLRGGYCFELNGIFALALDAFGFQRRPLLARVHVGGHLLYPRTHLLNLVNIDGRDWIADVGYGSNNLRAPMPFELNRVQVYDGVEFRLVDGGKFGITLQAHNPTGWQGLYSFDMGHVWPIDIEMGNHFTSTHPDVLFTQSRVATLANPCGKVTLLDFSLKEIENGQETITQLEPGLAYMRTLEAKFGIVLDEPYDAFKPLGYQPTENSLDFSAPDP